MNCFKISKVFRGQAVFQWKSMEFHVNPAPGNPYKTLCFLALPASPNKNERELWITAGKALNSLCYRALRGPLFSIRFRPDPRNLLKDSYKNF